MYGHLQNNCPLTKEAPVAEEHATPPVTNQQQAESCSFGPWMMVERRQRKPPTKQGNLGKSSTDLGFQGSRFNLLSDLENGDNNLSDIPSAPLVDVPIRQVTNAAAIPRVKARSKGKLPVTTKQSMPISLRKSPVVNFSEFSILQRGHSTASSSNPPALDQSKHSAVVVNENSDPNVLVSPGVFTTLSTNGKVPPTGEPPDQRLQSSTGVNSPVPVDISLQSKLTDVSSDERGSSHAEAVNFFSSLFSCPEGPVPTFPIHGAFPPIDADLMSSLDSSPSVHEIYDALMAMAPLKSPGPLHCHLQPDALLSPIDSFSELIDSSENWDRDKLCATFHPDVVPHILGVKCPEPTDIPNQIIWRWTSKGNFEVRSAYSNLASGSWDPNLALWKLIWRMAVPQRLRVFLWVVSRRKLMTNLERCNRHISSSSLYPLCNEADESIVHVLRDCRASSAVWELILPSSLSSSFAQPDLLAWIENNLRSGMIHTEWDIPWSSIFVSTIWQLWKSRNDFVFNAVLHSKEIVVRRAITWAHYYSGCCPPCNGVTTLHYEPPTWRRPDPGWICLNVDGAVSRGSNAGAVGGLFRDHSGAWIAGFQQAIGKCSPLHAELWALFIGFQYAWELGFTTLQIQTDCKEVVNMLHALDTDRSAFTLVRAIAKLRQKCWMTDIIWIPRDGNRAVDMLAKSTDTSAHDMLRLLTPPRALISLLQDEAPAASFT
ncbi:hypothetical protein V6N11_061841 [Hibiscus sabdariffa]|uniref:RNase H type-1 domain-containing protein n=1 Tax=Hibiscus sabdariffa TaxID=183260 RepID=A0ABR1ZK15_9ROSI